MGEYELSCPEQKLIFPTSLLYRLIIENDNRTFRADVTTYKKKVRYRYPGEDWQEIEADDYSLTQDFDPNNTVFSWYLVEFNAEVAERFPPTLTKPAIHNAGDIIRVGGFQPTVGIFLDSIYTYDLSDNYYFGFDYVFARNGICERRSYSQIMYSKDPASSGKVCRTEAGGSTIASPAIKNISNPELIEDTSRQPVTCNTINSDCTFRVYLCGQVIHEEVRDECPEVELIDCYREPVQSVFTNLNRGDTVIAIKGKVSFLPPLITLLWANIGRTFRGLAFDSTILSKLAQEGQENPEECLLFLKVIDFDKIDIIGQFCSTCSCPFPDYVVDCAGGCPDNTCEVNCGDHICCYNNEGKSVLTINKAN